MIASGTIRKCQPGRGMTAIGGEPDAGQKSPIRQSLPERTRRDSCHYYLPFLAAPCWMVAAARASVMAPIGRGLVRTDTAELAVGLAAASESRKPSLVDSLD